MAERERVRSYQRRTKSGQVITVESHSRTNEGRTNEEVSSAAKKVPGRPQMAAKGGKFAGGRSTPNVWAKPVDRPAPNDPQVMQIVSEPEEPQEQQRSSPKKRAQPRPKAKPVRIPPENEWQD